MINNFYDRFAGKQEHQIIVDKYLYVQRRIQVFSKGGVHHPVTFSGKWETWDPSIAFVQITVITSIKYVAHFAPMWTSYAVYRDGHNKSEVYYKF